MARLCGSNNNRCVYAALDAFWYPCSTWWPNGPVFVVHAIGVPSGSIGLRKLVQDSGCGLYDLN